MSDLSRTLLLIGHRGTGKSSLLRSLASLGETIDLDERIERSSGRSIPDIFAEEGEAAFRRRERSELERILCEPSPGFRVIALGAGFDAEIPGGVRCVWVRRETDARGRIFLDRPRLNAATDPLHEYLERFASREGRYAALAHETLTLREGLSRAPDFFADTLKDVGGSLTLLKENFRGDFGAFLRRRLAWGVNLFEVRDDLLGADEIQAALEILPPEKILYSFRRTPTANDSPGEAVLWDWDLDLGACPWPDPPVCSLHTRRAGEKLADFFARLENNSGPFSYLKAAPVIESFAELKAGHDWWRQNPCGRVFLPRSPDGGVPRWRWYRLLLKGATKINFIREGTGSAPDQPTLLEWLDAPARADLGAFAAVLGDPVDHSHTPTEQHAFFAARGMPCVAIRVTESEWRDQGALEILRELGLSHVIVTSPLKRLGFEAAKIKDDRARELESVNTLAWDEGAQAWRGTSTDLAGFQSALEGLDLTQEVAVWGGGGVLSIVRHCLPSASGYSAREGTLRFGPGVGDPHIVVWAANAESHRLPRSWHPRVVVDLNYFEDSSGRAYALSVGAKYLSGLRMFRRQAAEQRRFWSQL